MVKLLIVDDDEMLRRAVVRYFKLVEGLVVVDDIEVHQAGDAEEALNLIESGLTPSHVLSDLEMGPGVSGLELLSLLRERFPNAKLLLMTGNVSITDLAERSQELGIAFLNKPAHHTEIVQALNLKR